MNFDKIRKFCSPFRVVLGLVCIAYGIYSANYWFFLGVVPLIVGIFNICPLCKITNKCDIFNKNKSFSKE